MPYTLLKKARHYTFFNSLITFIVLWLALLLYTSLVDQKMFAVILFWLLVVPQTTILTALLNSIPQKRIASALWGNAMFYACVYFLIYKHTKSDYFKLFAISFIISIIYTIIALLPANRNVST